VSARFALTTHGKAIGALTSEFQSGDWLVFGA
jgi:hypothetical protein